MESSTKIEDDPLQFYHDEVDVNELIRMYWSSKHDLEDFLDQQQDNFDVRFNNWSGKSDDYRKHARASIDGEPFPWDGASDMAVWLTDELIKYHVSICMNAFRKSHLTATPTEGSDIARASVVSNFMKWMVRSRMSEFEKELEIGLNNFLEKGIMSHYIYWQQDVQKVQESVSLEELAQLSPNFVDDLMSKEFDDEIAELLIQIYGMSNKKAKKVIKELRNTGQAIFGVPRLQINRPAIKALAPDEDFWMPSYTINPDKAEFICLGVNYSADELRGKVLSDGWDNAWVEYACEHLRGQHKEIQQDFYRDRVLDSTLNTEADDETIRVVYMYQTLLDEDGVPGRYCTVFHPNLSEEGATSQIGGAVKQLYAKRELLDYKHGKYPIVATKREDFSKRFYETRGYPEILKPLQFQLKAEIDCTIDRASLTTLPPLIHPNGRPPLAWGPGVRIGARRPDEYRFADIPKYDPTSMEVRREIMRMAYEYVGKNFDGVDPNEVAVKQQALVEKMFSHLNKILDQVYSLYQQYGPDEEWFRIIGVKDVEKYQKGDPRERYDFSLAFDSTTQDPSMIIDRVRALTEFTNSLDRSGTMDTDRLLQMVVEQVGPGWGEQVILPKETAVEKSLEEERSALTQIKNGFDLDVKPVDNHQLKLQIDEMWAQQPDIQQALMQDEAFRERFTNYTNKRQFMVQQQQNAQIGRMGGMPSQFGQTE